MGFEIFLGKYRFIVNVWLNENVYLNIWLIENVYLIYDELKRYINILNWSDL